MRDAVFLGLLLLSGCAPTGGDDDDDNSTDCAPGTPAEAAACVHAAAWSADLTLLAVVRPPGTPGWQPAQDHCRTPLGDLGFEVETHECGTGTNIVGPSPGSDSSHP